MTAAGPTPDARLRIRLTTTSDWTSLTLVSGAAWETAALVSASPEATTAEVRSDQFALAQPIARAETGQGVEMTVEAQGSAWTPGRMVVFRVERGDIGFARTEIFRPADGDWALIRTITWEGTSGDGKNAYAVSVSANDLFGEPVAATATPASGLAATPVSTPVSGLSASPVAPVTGMPQGTAGYPWWNDSVFYEIFVRSFSDSNGDGIGDLNGLTQELDYLNDGDPSTDTDLGISGIWLMPIFPSPSYHGYDVTDYYAVNPQYGTLEDLKNLLAAAHERGIRIIIDLVLNHTSSRHPWFVQARDPASPYHDWYVWSDTDPGYSGSWGQRVWYPLDGRYYYSVFTAGMPDLNYTNPEVTAEMAKVVRFWLEEVGVDGFRLDAAKHIIEEGAAQIHTQATHRWYEAFRTVYKQSNPQAIAVGELWDEIGLSAEYVQGDELDLGFEFYLADSFVRSADDGDAMAVRSTLRLVDAAYPPLQFAPFLTNHDQERVLTVLGADVQRAKVAASMLLTAPGVPFLYYGEEIGLQGEKPDELIRRPMQWSPGPSAGFTTGPAWQAPGPGWETFNVALETDDPDSLLVHYRALIRARNQHAALRVGGLRMVTSSTKVLYSILRVSDEETVLIVINPSRQSVDDYSLSLDKSDLPPGIYLPAPILGTGTFAPLQVTEWGGFSKYVPVGEIPPYATFILQLQPAGS